MKCIKLIKEAKRYRKLGLTISDFICIMDISNIEENENRCMAVWLAMCFRQKDNPSFLSLE